MVANERGRLDQGWHHAICFDSSSDNRHDCVFIRRAALTGLFEAKTPSARSIFECASKGDPAALGLFDRMGWALGLALANLFTALGIRHAILGGGVSGAWDLFIGPLRKTLSENMSMLPAAQAVVLKSALGESAAPVGAARMAFLGAGESVNR